VNTIDPKQNVIKIVEELKEDAAQRRRRLDGFLVHDENSTDWEDDRQFDFDAAVVPLQLDALPPQRNDSKYKLRNLLAYDDREFVNNAYRAILKRPPDEAGLKNSVEQLRQGKVDKIDILYALASSREGQEKGVRIPGLLWRASIRRITRAPVLKSVARPVYNGLRFSSIARKPRQTAIILARQETIARYINDNVTGQLRSIGKVVQKVLNVLETQRKANELVLQRISELSTYCEERLNEESMQHRQEVKDRAAEIEDVRRVYNKYRTQVELTEKDLKRDMELLFRKYQEVKTELVYQGQRLGSMVNQTPDQSPETIAPAAKSETTNNSRALDAFFAAFDEHFRGNRDEVKQRLRAYLPVVREHLGHNGNNAILDIACGRGEWLELLKEENFPASGVDVNGVLIAQCRERGLDAVQADLHEHLRKLANDSLGAVSAFHIVEHIPIEELVDFLDQALRVLRPGGLLLVETPNPTNVLVGSCNFYFDPTHRNPIPSPVLRFLIESRGFVVVSTFGLNPSDEKPIASDSELAQRFNEYFYGPMDYAIVARKV
jgi:O-antigen chain-terminating methyltransferase